MREKEVQIQVREYRELLSRRGSLSEEEERTRRSLLEKLFREPLSDTELQGLKNSLALVRSLVTSPKLAKNRPPSLPYFKDLVYGIDYLYREEPLTEKPHYAAVSVQNGRATVVFTPLFRTLTEEEFKAVFLHQLFHILLDHWDTPRTRRLLELGMIFGLPKERALETLETAADLAINSQLREMGFALPPDMIAPEDYGLPPLRTTEWYYLKLLEAMQKALEENSELRSEPSREPQGREEGPREEKGGSREDEGQGKGGQEGQERGENQNPSQKGGQGGKEPDGEPEGPRASPSGYPSEGHPGPPGGGGGLPETPGETPKEPPPKGSAGGDGRGGNGGEGSSNGADKPRGSPENLAEDLLRGRAGHQPMGRAGFGQEPPVGLDNLKRRVAEGILDFAQKGIGNVPDYLSRWAEDLLDPQVPWQDVLREALGMTVDRLKNREDALDPSSFDWIESAVAGGEILFPNPLSLAPRVAVIVDTSGSMGREEILQAASEVLELAKSLGEGVTLITFDTEVKAVVETRYLEDLKMALVGGGGTDLIPAFDAAKKLRPDLYVVITDGYVSEWPKDITEHEVVIVCTSQDAPLPEGVRSIRIDVRRKEHEVAL